MVDVRWITPDDPLYARECDLRERVLLGPVGFTLAQFAEAYGDESRFEHAVAVMDHPARGAEVVGCALLLPDDPEPGVGKVMQVAVSRQLQGQGIGRRVMTAVEARAFGELGLVELFCHAQLPAVPFYERLGWRADPETFEEAGIPHRRMWVRAEPGAHPDA